MPGTPVFDGHNDVLLRLWTGAAGTAARADGWRGTEGHVNAGTVRAGGMAGGLCAIFVPGAESIDMAAFETGDYRIALPGPVGEATALPVAAGQAALLLELDRRGDLALCRSAAEIRAAMAAGRFAAVMHMEGAEAIGPDLAALDVFHAAGLRSLGPVWSRPNRFAEGVPFAFPGDPDEGGGLTADGRRLVARAALLRIAVDVSHLNAAGVRDVAALGVPVIASHSNAHALCPHSRNLTDAQLRLAGETGGLVGLNFAAAFLRPDGRMQGQGAFAWMVPHLAHMVELAGEDHVGLGSDFDGATVPDEIGSAAGLPALVAAMEREGFGAALIEKICWRNWVECLGRIWGT